MRRMTTGWCLLALIMGVGFCALAADEVVFGQYSVPVPTELARYATWDTRYTVSKDADGKLLIDYCLPEDVVGPNAPPIHLKEIKRTESGLFEFEGTHGRGSCKKTSKSLTCFIIYPGYPIDLDAVKNLLRKKYGGADTDDSDGADLKELEARFQIADLFSADPKGIINWKRP